MNFTQIEMEWTDKGARVVSTIAINCPRCHETVPANSEHRCGDRMEPIKKGLPAMATGKQNAPKPSARKRGKS